MEFKLLRLDGVREYLGLSRSSIYREIAEGRLTKPVRITEATVGWPAAEISAVCRARIAGRTDAEVKALVRELEAARVQEAA